MKLQKFSFYRYSWNTEIRVKLSFSPSRQIGMNKTLFSLFYGFPHRRMCNWKYWSNVKICEIIRFRWNQELAQFPLIISLQLKLSTGFGGKKHGRNKLCSVVRFNVSKDKQEPKCRRRSTMDPRRISKMWWFTSRSEEPSNGDHILCGGPCVRLSLEVPASEAGSHVIVTWSTYATISTTVKSLSHFFLLQKRTIDCRCVRIPMVVHMSRTMTDIHQSLCRRRIN